MASITDTVLALSGDSGYDSNGGDFDILRDLLITADAISEEPFAGIGLVAALDTLEDLTVFAPDDDAFTGLASTIASVTGNVTPADEGASIGFLADVLTLLGGGDASGVLTDILTYHVSGELVSSTKLIEDGEASTLFGETITLNADDFTLIDLDPGLPDPALDLTQLDIGVDNGIIHVIEGVLFPAEVSAILLADDTDLKIGGDGNDSFNTGDGADFIDGNDGNDTIRAGDGDDVAIGGAGNDKMSGGRGQDILLGEGGNDKIAGGWGNDTIEGGEGNDTINAGLGADTIVFKNGSDHDTVKGFQDGLDMLDLSGYDGVHDFHDVNVKGGWYGTTVEFGDGDSVYLAGVHSYQVDESDFIFAADLVA